MEFEINGLNKFNFTNMISKKYSITTVLFFIIVYTSFAQCPRGLYCDKQDLGNYDYRGQTSYATMSPGDTSNITIVSYAKRDMRILVCGDRNLGGVKFIVKEFVKSKRKVVKEIKKETGYLGYEEVTVRDTIWGMASYFEEIIIFDSEKSDKFFYEEKVKTTTRYSIEVIVPEGNDDIIGCVSIMVGYKPSLSTKFK